MSTPVEEYADPFRLRVMKALCASLEQITPTNGYKHDLTGAVFRGRDLFGGDPENGGDPIPMLSILEPPLPIDQITAPPIAQTSMGDWDLLVQGFVFDDLKNPCDPAYVLLADVKKRLAYEKARTIEGSRGSSDPFGMGRAGNGVCNSVKELVIGPGVVRPPGDGVSDKAYFWLTLTLKITEDIEQPFL